MPRFQHTHNKVLISFAAENDGSEKLYLNGELLSEGDHPVWPGDHAVRVLIDGAWTVVEINGRTTRMFAPRTYEYKLFINGRQEATWVW